jgi:hypothetical protein
LAIGFILRAFFFAFFFADFFAFFFAGFLAFFAFFLAGFLAFFFAAFLFLPERRFAFLAGFFAIFFAGRRFLADFFLPEDFFLVDFFAAFLFAAISDLLIKVKQRELPALRRMDLLGANCQCPAARHIGRMTGHRAVLLAADEDLPCPQHDS